SRQRQSLPRPPPSAPMPSRDWRRAAAAPPPGATGTRQGPPLAARRTPGAPAGAPASRRGPARRPLLAIVLEPFRPFLLSARFVAQEIAHDQLVGRRVDLRQQPWLERLRCHRRIGLGQPPGHDEIVGEPAALLVVEIGPDVEDHPQPRPPEL